MKKKLTRMAALAAALVAVTAAPAAAQGAETSGSTLVLLDNAFVLVCGALVVFMQAGFAMVEAGLTRAKNAAHMMLKNLMDFIVGATGFALVGYHIAFNGADYIGWAWQWASPTTPAPLAENLTTPVHFFYMMGFAAAASTILSGAVAERVKFSAYFAYSIGISAFLYPVVVSWVWGGGWLSKLDTPFVDFAGGTVVHTTGGMAALVGALILGPRIGRYDADGNSTPIPGHNLPLAILGVFILLVGWFGFNGGSLLAADLLIGQVVAVTALGAAAGGIGATMASWLTLKTPDVTLIGNGVLGGLVGITAGATTLSIFGAMVVGLFAGMIATNGVLLLDRLRIDDPVGAVPVHLFCGVFGTLAIGILADPDVQANGDGPAGLLYGGGMSLMLSQIAGVVTVMTFSAIGTGVLFSVLKSLGQLRVSVEDEMAGLDLAEHSTPAYNDDYVEYEDAGVADIASIDDLLDDLSWIDETV